MACLTEDTAFDFVQGGLPAEEAARLEEHLDECAGCRAFLGTVGRVVGAIDEAAAGAEACQPGEPGARADRRAGEAPTALPLVRRSVVGRYVILDLIGGGGMGLVYAAFDPELDRKVALKIVRPDATSGDPVELRTRLVREAQAVARLSHPNVVAIHDVGTIGDQVFLAMELVDGPTLARWLAARPRPWREVVEMFARAGAGLAAAHAAGLIHRDFKPQNVLVGRDGRPRVVDFGLARPAPAAAEGTGADGAATPGPDAAARPHHSAFAGTPRYMAPEQHRRRPADERSDQYSFCVALYEELYGELPGDAGEGDTRAPRVGAARAHAPRRGVPGWVRRVVLRGLSAAPEDRYPSMAALLAALTHDPRRRWWGKLAMVAAATVVVAGALAYRDQALRERAACQATARRLAGIWDAHRKQTAHEAVRATAAPDAEAAWARTVAKVDAYVATWVGARTAACEARRRGGPMGASAVVSLQCLDGRLEEVRALSDLLVHADREVVAHASQVVANLSPLDRCVEARVRPKEVRPRPPARAQGDALRARIAGARTKAYAGKFSEALPAAREVATAAHTLGDRLLETEALRTLAAAQTRMGDFAGAEDSLWQALSAAAAGGHDEEAAAAWVALVPVIGATPSRHDFAERCAQQAAATIEHLGGDEILQATLSYSRGGVAYYRGRYAEAEAHFRRAVGLWEKLRADSWWATPSLLGLGRALADEGKVAEGLALLQRALATIEREYGAEHPHLVFYLVAVADALDRQGDAHESGALARRALAIAERNWKDGHYLVASSLAAVAKSEAALGRQPIALAQYREALRVLAKTAAPDDPAVGAALGGIGDALRALGHHQEALAEHRRALELLRRTWGPGHPQVARAQHDLAATLIALGRHDEAVPLLEGALAVRAQAAIPPADLAATRRALAQARRAGRRDPDEAPAR